LNEERKRLKNYDDQRPKFIWKLRRLNTDGEEEDRHWKELEHAKMDQPTDYEHPQAQQ